VSRPNGFSAGSRSSPRSPLRRNSNDPLRPLRARFTTSPRPIAKFHARSILEILAMSIRSITVSAGTASLRSRVGLRSSRRYSTACQRMRPQCLPRVHPKQSPVWPFVMQTQDDLAFCKHGFIPVFHFWQIRIDERNDELQTELGVSAHYTE